MKIKFLQYIKLIRSRIRKMKEAEEQLDELNKSQMLQKLNYQILI